MFEKLYKKDNSSDDVESLYDEPKTTSSRRKFIHAIGGGIIGFGLARNISVGTKTSTSNRELPRNVRIDNQLADRVRVAVQNDFSGVNRAEHISARVYPVTYDGEAVAKRGLELNISLRVSYTDGRHRELTADKDMIRKTHDFRFEIPHEHGTVDTLTIEVYESSK